jgi:MFS family permease
VPSVLHEREFRLLFAGQAVSLLGDGLFEVALAFAVLDATGSRAGLGVVLAAGALPLVAFVLVGGVVADRLPRRGLMIAADLVRMVVQGTVAVLLVTDHAGLVSLALLNAAFGAAAAFFTPAFSGILPELLPRDELRPANALINVTRSTAGIAGAAAAGLLVDHVGSAAAIAIDAGSFAVSAAFLARLRPPARPADDDGAPAFARELAEGFGEVRRRRWLWMLILNAALFLMLYVGPMQVVGPIVSRSDYGGASAWGFMSAAFALGMAGGGLLVMLVQLRRPMFHGGVGFLVTLVTPLLLARAAPIGIVCAGFLLEGFAVGVYGTTWEIVRQQAIPPHLQGRVSAWDWMGSLAGFPLGLAVAGPLVSAVGTDAMLYGMAASAALLTAWLLAVRDIRDLRVAPAGAVA